MEKKEKEKKREGKRMIDRDRDTLGKDKRREGIREVWKYNM